MMIVWAALTGANLVHDVGYLESGMTSSLPMLVASDELISCVKRMAGPVHVDRDSLAVEAMARVGAGGNFLQDEHTVQYLRREHWFPRLADRNNFKRWTDQGGTDHAARCRQRCRELLSEPHAGRVETKTAARIEAILCES